MSTTLRHLPWALLLGASALAQPASGPPRNGVRDPMRPPAAPTAPAAASAAAEAPSLPAVHHLLVIGDRRWVVDGGQRRGVGDLLGGARIERIDDDAVVVRQGKALHRLPLHAGVRKLPPTEPNRR